LSGVRVLELASLIPGPFCGLTLAELGADVVKVEPPGGDPMRLMPPMRGETSALFDALNRGKRSVCLNLKDPDQRDQFLALTSEADIVIEGWRPGVAKRLGVDATRLRQHNPRLIYCAITGYGQQGHYSTRAFHDINVLSLTGVLGATGNASGPVLPAVQIGDFSGGGQQAVIALLAALRVRDRDGVGCMLDVSMSAGVRALMPLMHARLVTTGYNPGPGEDPLAGSMPSYRIYAASDGHLAVGAIELKFWERFCAAIGCEHLALEPYATGERAASVIAEIEAITSQFSVDEWRERLKETDCCVGIVRTPTGALADPEIEFSQALIEIIDGDGNPTHYLPAIPAIKPAASCLRPAPALGEHQADICRPSTA
jgi:crotonobetainyl-CoA:carnitine CoA-transferase CaiB-like acyl-CoA transferase